MDFICEVGFCFLLCCGEDVCVIQQVLIILQNELFCGIVDGIYGGVIKQVVIEYQWCNSLEFIGVVDVFIWVMLFKVVVECQQVVFQGVILVFVKVVVVGSQCVVVLLVEGVLVLVDLLVF